MLRIGINKNVRLSGFSITELLIVVAIIGAIVVAGAPMLGVPENTAQRTSQDMIKAQLQQARAHAISSGKSTAIVIPSLGSSVERGARSIAVLEVIKSSAGYLPLLDANGKPRMLHAWQNFSGNMAFASGAEISTTKQSIMDFPPNVEFSFKGKSYSCHSIVFAPSGQITHPAAEIQIAIAAAVNRAGRLVFTQRNGCKPNVTCLQVNRLTARVRSSSLE
jgi:prepilin-type N-terminal cleavage/methylation domain-containing protein